VIHLHAKFDLILQILYSAPNSRPRSLYVVVRLSVVCRLSSVTFVYPTQAIEIFGNVFTPLVPWPPVTFR